MRKGLMVIAVLLAGGAIVSARAATPDAFEEQWVAELASRLQPGLRRAEVETIFMHHVVGAQPANATLYQQGDWMIEVPFDRTGGIGMPDNRINGPVKIEPAE